MPKKESKVEYNKFLTRVADTAGLTKADTDKVLRALGQEMGTAIENREVVYIPSVFRLRYIDSKERKGFNPGKNEEFTIPAKTRVRIDAKSDLIKAASELNA